MLNPKLYKNKKFLIFDFDGTIADSSPIHKRAFQEIFKEFAVPILYDEIAGKNTRNAIEFISKKNFLNLNPTKINESIIQVSSLLHCFFTHPIISIFI